MLAVILGSIYPSVVVLFLMLWKASKIISIQDRLIYTAAMNAEGFFYPLLDILANSCFFSFLYDTQSDWSNGISMHFTFFFSVHACEGMCECGPWVPWTSLEARQRSGVGSLLSACWSLVSRLSCSVQSKQAGSGGDLGDPPISASLAALLEDSGSIPSTHMMMPYRNL